MLLMVHVLVSRDMQIWTHFAADSYCGKLSDLHYLCQQAWRQLTSTRMPKTVMRCQVYAITGRVEGSEVFQMSAYQGWVKIVHPQT